MARANENARLSSLFRRQNRAGPLVHRIASAPPEYHARAVFFSVLHKKRTGPLGANQDLRVALDLVHNITALQPPSEPAIVNCALRFRIDGTQGLLLPRAQWPEPNIRAHCAIDAAPPHA